MIITQNELTAFVIGILLGAGLVYLYIHLRRRDTQEIATAFLEQARLHLGAMSAEALQKNSDLVLTAARETLSSQVDRSERDLNAKKDLINQTLGAMKNELDAVQSLVSQLEKDREAKFGEVSEQLRQAAEQTGSLQKTTEQLRQALANTRVRGQWGERMAEDVLRTAGFIEGVNYYRQQLLANSNNRPDYTFLLPRGLKVHMDVKFPLDNYLKHLEAETEDESRRCKDRFLQDVKARIKEVTRRDYIDRSDNTIDYVIIFIPNEQIFSFINQNAPMLLDEALQVHVILCSPFTLFGILAIIRQAIDHFYLEERTTQVLEVLAGFRKQWNTFIDSFERLGKKIDAVQDEFAGLTTKKRSQIDRQLSRIEDLRQLEESPLSTGEDVIGEHEHTNKVIYRVGANDQKKKFVSDDTDSDNDISL